METDLRTAESVGSTPEGFVRVLVPAAEAERFLSVLPAKKISQVTSVGNQWKAATNDGFFKEHEFQLSCGA
jgi:hypothetical protein